MEKPLCPPPPSSLQCFSPWLKAGVQTEGETDSHSPWLSLVGTDYFVCASSSLVCVHVYEAISRWWSGGEVGGSGVLHLPCQAALTGSPFRGEWQYANGWPPSATTTTGRRWGCGEAVSRSHTPTQNPSPPSPLRPPPPFLSPGIGFCFSEIMWSTAPFAPPPHTHLLHTGSFELSFCCCYLTSLECLWLAFHTRPLRIV